MKLSILICTIYKRKDQLFDLLDNLYRQRKSIENGSMKVEIIYLGDFQNMSVGEKRNLLLNMAFGEYVVFIDDDDHVSDEYMGSILKGIEDNPGIDCLAIGGYETKRGDPGTKKIYSFEKEHGKNYNFRATEGEFKGKLISARLPNHICVWKRETALRVKFPGKNLGEDHEWAEQQMLLGYDYVKLEGEHYHYDFNPDTTETRR